MKFTSRAARRIGVATIAMAAIGVPGIALAAPGSAGRPSTSATAPRCLRSQLTAWIGIPGDGTAGSTFYQLELSNVSSSRCTLFGFPGVSALGSLGRQLGSPAGRDHADPVTLVTLGRGQTAHVLLQITDVGVFPPSACQPATAAELKVFPPNDFTALRIPFSFRACRASGPVYLHVRTTVAGTGIPGFSS